MVMEHNYPESESQLKTEQEIVTVSKITNLSKLLLDIQESHEDDKILDEPIVISGYNVNSICGRRSKLEDTHKIIEKGKYVYYGIFDGHAGTETSEILKEKLDQFLFKILDKFELNEESTQSHKKLICEVLIKGCIDFDIYLYNEKDNLGIKQSGSTAIIIIEICSVLFFINLGDSRALLVTENQIIFETKDHKPADEITRIENAGGIIIKNKTPRIGTAFSDTWIAISRTFGDFNFKTDSKGQFITAGAVIPKPEITAIDKPKTGFLILACDGLFEKMTSTEVADFVIANQGKSNICELLNNEGLRCGSADNITSIIVYL